MSKKDKYYLKKYGITEAEVQKMDEEQDSKCGICGRPQSGRRLAVDHDHKYVTRKLFIERLPDWNYGVFLDETSASCIAIGTTKTEARTNARRVLTRKSVRGLLCSQCNRALGKVEDPRWKWGPEQLRRAADYLERWNGKRS